MQTTGIEDANNASFSTILFPNPANENEINLMVNGRNLSNTNYSITDVSGKIVQEGNVNMQSNIAKFKFENGVENGNYVLKITDKNNNETITEKFILNR